MRDTQHTYSSQRWRLKLTIGEEEGLRETFIGLRTLDQKCTSDTFLFCLIEAALYLVSTAHLKTHSNIREGIREQWERIASLIPSLIMRRW